MQSGDWFNRFAELLLQIKDFLELKDRGNPTLELRFLVRCNNLFGEPLDYADLKPQMKKNWSVINLFQEVQVFKSK